VGGKEVNEKPRGPQAREVKSLKLPKSMIIGDNVTLSGFYEDDGEAGPRAEAVEDRPSRATGGDQVSVYRQVAPATVIISTPGGYGSGVIYHKDGWVLTNHHVIAHAAREDFRMKVNVSLGKLNASGVMERRTRTYEAHVHKQDPLRDLAVLKIIDPPADLKVVNIAAKDPPPGLQVWALGHAGIGLVWAVKGGQIAAVGKLSTHLAQLLLIDSQRAAAGKGPLSGSLAKLKARRLEKMRKEMARQKPALVIQSTCDISQGDSGGPLVNAAGDLVGVNAFIRGSYGTRKESNFHIHVSEVRKFIQEVPGDPPQLIPDPWTEGGTIARLGDADLDARVDVLAMYRMKRRRLFSRGRPTCYFLDLDQDSFAGTAALPAVSDIVAKRTLDAELTFLEAARHLYAWFDTDNDGKHDLLLTAPSHRRTRVEGYQVDGKGMLSRDKKLDGRYLVRPELFADEAQRKRLLAMGPLVFDRTLMSGFPTKKVAPPHPLKGAGHQGKLRDLSGDGKPDAVASEGLFSSGTIMDLDQDSLGTLKMDAPLKQVLEQGKVDAEFSWITRARDRWIWYDADNDGRFELLLQTTRAPWEYAERAWTVGQDGKRAEAPGFVGRTVVRPDLFADARLGQALLKAAGRTIAARSRPREGVLGSFPDPARYYTWGIRFLKAGKKEQVGINVRYAGCKGVLVDLDRDSLRRARKAGKSMWQLVRARKFDAELVHLRCGSKQWMFYDTRGAGSFDLVLFSGSYGAAPAIDAAYRVTRKGKLEVRPLSKAGCKGLVHPSLFRKRALKRALKKMAPHLFSPTPDLKCKP